MHLKTTAALAALLPAAVVAQTTVFSTDFSSGERASANANVDVGDWTIASTKAVTGIGYAANAFNFGMNSTSSGLVEAQSRFTTTPVTLAQTGDWIELTVKFTNANRILAGGSGSALNVGLYDTGASNPIAILTGGSNTPAGGTTLSSTADSANATGFAQNWEGYVGRIANSAGSNAVFTRPMQASTASANQELLFSNVGGGSYGNPAGGTAGTVVGSTVASTQPILTASEQYTLTFRITLASETSYDISYNLLNGTGTTNLQSITRTASGATFINGLNFDGLAIGYRYSLSPAEGATAISINSVQVQVNSAIPEPSSYAAFAGLATLAISATRRRRR